MIGNVNQGGGMKSGNVYTIREQIILNLEIWSMNVRDFSKVLHIDEKDLKDSFRSLMAMFDQYHRFMVETIEHQPL